MPYRGRRRRVAVEVVESTAPYADAMAHCDAVDAAGKKQKQEEDERDARAAATLGTGRLATRSALRGVAAAAHTQAQSRQTIQQWTTQVASYASYMYRSNGMMLRERLEKVPITL
jgi:hypothetical protein